MNEIADLFRQAVPVKSRVSNGGWVEFNCPACNDTRMRGGFMETGDGGFVYKCFNGGCEYEKPTGWIPGWGLHGRNLRLFESLGGDIHKIPIELLMKASPSLYDATGKRIEPDTSMEMHWQFPEVAMPKEAKILDNARGKHPEEARAWLKARGGFFFGRYTFLWSPAYPRHVIVPFQHHGKYVGWIGRRIDPGRYSNSHIKSADNPEHYMLNQHLLSYKRLKRIYVMQGQFDAIALNGLCTFGSRLTQPMVNILNASGKEIILLSDYKGDEWRSYFETARTNSWKISCPMYRGWESQAIKDPGDSIKKNGLMTTLYDIGNAVTDNYQHAETVYRMCSR